MFVVIYYPKGLIIGQGVKGSLLQASICETIDYIGINIVKAVVLFPLGIEKPHLPEEGIVFNCKSVNLLSNYFI